MSVLEKKEENHHDAGIRITARWARKHLGLAVDRKVASGLTMIPIEPPGEFVTGSPENEPGRVGGEAIKYRKISYAFEVGATEITVEEFLAFDPYFGYASDVTPNPNCPINRTSMLDAIRFCRWLNEKQPDFDPDWTCYPPIDYIKLACNCRRIFTSVQGIVSPPKWNGNMFVGPDPGPLDFLGTVAIL
jgi:formylglycine-generating enzyme required for sulfatase activity